MRPYTAHFVISVIMEIHVLALMMTTNLRLELMMDSIAAKQRRSTAHLSIQT